MLTPDEIQAEIDNHQSMTLTSPDGSTETLSSSAVAIEQLIMRAENPRKNTDAATALAKAISEVGWGSPLLIQKSTGKIIGGHTRMKAARILGLKRLPVRVVDVDDRRAKAMALADNRLGELAGWDFALLADDLSEFGLDEAELLGFDSKFLEDIADKIADFGPLQLPDETMQEPIVPGGHLVEIRCDGEAALTVVLDAIAAVKERGDVTVNISA